MEDIYEYEKRLESILRRTMSSKEISKENKRVIDKFVTNCFAKPMGKARIIRYLYCLRDLAIWLKKDFLKASINDLKDLIAKIERMEKYAPGTKYEYRATLKRFYKSIKDEEEPKEVSWIKLTFKNSNEKLNSELLTEDEILKLIEQSLNLRDKAIISTLYESGCRIGEFIKLKIKDIIKDENGIILCVTGKTGARKVMVIDSEPYLIEWLNNHPYKSNPEAFLWIQHNKNEMISYAYFRKMLKVTAKRAGIEKHVNPHNFRHSRATYLADKFNEQQLKQYMGWKRNSDMTAVYIHLNGNEATNAVLRLHGITKKEDTQLSKLKPKICLRCKQQNKPTALFCNCGYPLDEATINEIKQRDMERQQVDEMMKELIKNKEILKYLVENIKKK